MYWQLGDGLRALGCRASSFKDMLGPPSSSHAPMAVFSLQLPVLPPRPGRLHSCTPALSFPPRAERPPASGRPPPPAVPFPQLSHRLSPRLTGSLFRCPERFSLTAPMAATALVPLSVYPSLFPSVLSVSPKGM